MAQITSEYADAAFPQHISHSTPAIVGQSALAVLSHKQQSADLGKVLVVVYNRGWSD